ncbi:uncharacterized protein [Asterias amurensis]|uniref:uncharacterized protein isoform X3 n=1 Tax=Asterias amurensis TaxID=7602 RepID=UPI003AB8E8DF
MQGDWWHRGCPNKPKESYSYLSSSSRAWEIPKTESGTSPKIVTLTVQPLLTEQTVNQHCASRSRNLSISSTESVLAQRRRKLSFKNKTLLNNTRPVSMSVCRENLEVQDLTWTNFFEKHFCGSSSNSPYNTGQELNASGSFNSSQQESITNNNRPVPSTENSYRLLERKLEREREKRTHGEAPPQPSRLDSKGLTLRRLGLHVPPATFMHSAHLNPIQTLQLSTVLPEETSPSAMDIRRNGFRLTGKSTNATRTAAADQSTTSSGSYRTASNKDVLSSMGTLTVAATPSSAALRGQSVGFGGRDRSTRSPTQRSKTRGGTMLPLTGNDKNKNGRYPYIDPVHSASPSFQQRLTELAALESDTIRYERTKRIKKRSKQENQ